MSMDTLDLITYLLSLPGPSQNHLGKHLTIWNVKSDSYLGRILHFRDSTNCRTRNADHEDYTLYGEMLNWMSMIKMLLVKQCPLLRCRECRCEWGSAKENLRSLPHPLSVWGHGLRFHFQPFTFSLSLSLRFPFLYNSRACSRRTCTVEQWLMWRFCAVPCGVSCPPPPPNQLGAVTNDCAIGCIR